MRVIVSNRLLKLEWYHDAPWRLWAHEKATRGEGLWSANGITADRGESMNIPWISEGSVLENGAIEIFRVSDSSASMKSNTVLFISFHAFFDRTVSGVIPGR
jgi:hypothetical protein